MQAALGLLPSRPTAAPLVAARERRPRARRAADARVALLEERVGRNAVPLEVVEGVLRRPRRERIHLVEPALVLLDDRDRGARRRLVASPAVDPGTHVREIAFERLHLVDVTAEVGIAGVEVETVALGELRPRHDRLELDEPQTEAAHDLVAIGERFGEVEPGVDEDDRGLGRDRVQHVGEHHPVVLERAGEHHVGSEPSPGPGDDVFGGGVLELAVPLRQRHGATVT